MYAGALWVLGAAGKHWTGIPFPFLWLQRGDVLVLLLIHVLVGLFPAAYAAISSHGVNGKKLCVPCEVVTYYFCSWAGQRICCLRICWVFDIDVLFFRGGGGVAPLPARPCARGLVLYHTRGGRATACIDFLSFGSSSSALDLPANMPLLLAAGSRPFNKRIVIYCTTGELYEYVIHTSGYDDDILKFWVDFWEVRKALREEDGIAQGDNTV